MPWSDVLPERGYTSYAGAAGEAACSEAVRFCVGVHRLRAAVDEAAVAEVEAAAASAGAATEMGPKGAPQVDGAVDAKLLYTDATLRKPTVASAKAAESARLDSCATDGEGGQLPERLADAPGVVLDPFCGQGSVLALANSWGLDAVGIDVNRKRCKVAASRLPQPPARA